MGHEQTQEFTWQHPLIVFRKWVDKYRKLEKHMGVARIFRKDAIGYYACKLHWGTTCRNEFSITTTSDKIESLFYCWLHGLKRTVKYSTRILGLARENPNIMWDPVLGQGGATIGSGWYIPPTFKSWGVQGGTSWLHRGVQITAFCRVVLACLSIHIHHISGSWMHSCNHNIA